MTFYLKPPDGSIPPYKFEQFAENRLRLLLAILDNPNKTLSEIIQCSKLRSSQLDCLVEGTPKDRVSHFALRASVIANFSLERVVHNGEKLLFEKRFESMTVHEMENSIKSCGRHLKEYKQFCNDQFKRDDAVKYMEITNHVLGKILSRNLLHCRRQTCAATRIDGIEEGMVTTKSSVICKIHGDSAILKVPFIHILDLVRNREVHLSNGLAHLTCKQLPVYLSTVFAKILEFSTYAMRRSETLRKSFTEDTRFSDISKRLRQIFQSHSQIGSPMNEGGGEHWLTTSRLLPAAHKITLATLDFEVAEYFPPCMRNHYTTLRRTHRLPHDSRFQLTLFLKDIGLPVEDCISLLKQEYSKSPAASAAREEGPTTSSSQSSISSMSSTSSSPGKCTHSWHKDQNRYVYGTRHMYGLEGARKNYSSHSCESIIKDTSLGCGDGCPFVDCHQNTVFLKNLEIDLDNQQLEGNVPEFLSGLRNETYTTPPIESCHVYLNYKRQKWVKEDKVMCSSLTQCPTDGDNYENETDDKPSSIDIDITARTASTAKTTLGRMPPHISKPFHFYTILKHNAV